MADREHQGSPPLRPTKATCRELATSKVNTALITALKLAADVGLEEAIVNGSATVLLKAIKDGEAVGLDASKLRDAKTLWAAEIEAEREVRRRDVPRGGWSSVVPQWRQLAWTRRLAEIQKWALAGGDAAGHERLAKAPLTESEAESEVRSFTAPCGGWSLAVPEWRQLTWSDRLVAIRKKTEVGSEDGVRVVAGNGYNGRERPAATPMRGGNGTAKMMKFISG